MLMVDGVLYLLVRNAGNSQLGLVGDRGKTWTWSDWKFTTSFGCPTFLNFGRNYAGARDDFVYVYSHDADSAYEPADRMVLARVPKERITRARRLRVLQAARRAGPARSGPRTSTSAARSSPIPGKCYRSGITLQRRPEALSVVPDVAGRRRPVSGRLRHLRRARAVGAVDDGLFHAGVGRRPRRNQQLSDQVDERRRQDPAPGLLRRRRFLRPQGDAHAGEPPPMISTSFATDTSQGQRRSISRDPSLARFEAAHLYHQCKRPPRACLVGGGD